MRNIVVCTGLVKCFISHQIQLHKKWLPQVSISGRVDLHHKKIEGTDLSILYLNCKNTQSYGGYVVWVKRLIL